MPGRAEGVEANDDENDKRMMKRIKANDPVAMSQMGVERHSKGDYNSALEHLRTAAELGNADAHHTLGFTYMEGEGVEKDEEKAVSHWEKAAIGGHPQARHNLGYIEERNGRAERAVKHFIIAANLGDAGSMKALWRQYKHGNITTEDLEATLRAHQAAVDATKSPQREEAEAFYGKNK